MRKVFFMTDSGRYHSNEDICSMVDYYERTGNYPDYFNESDINRFYDRYVIPYKEGVSEARNNNL